MSRFEEWEARGQERGRPTCPCGFRGGSRNIRAHRTSCPSWRLYCEFTAERARAAAGRDGS